MLFDVSTTIGIASVSSAARSCSTTENPSTPGIRRSTSTTAGCVAAHELDALLAVARAEHAVALGLQHRLHQRHGLRVVVDGHDDPVLARARRAQRRSAASTSRRPTGLTRYSAAPRA